MDCKLSLKKEVIALNKIKCCYKCVPPKRHPGCHAKCEEYLAEKRRLQELKDIENDARMKQDDLVKYDISRIERAKKRIGKR